MGITHLAGLGRHPGAVTAGLSYLVQTYGKRSMWGETVERVLIFTSGEVISGTLKAGEVVFNEPFRESGKVVRPGLPVVEVIRKFLEKECPDAELLGCPVDVHDFSSCFEAVAKVVLKYHPPAKTGKHVWANVTGGTNQLNLAIAQAAYLSGAIARLYYTFIADPKHARYLRPFSRDPSDFRFRFIEVLRMSFDERTYYVLELLEEKGPLSDEDMLSELRQRHVGFEGIDLQTFRTDYLHVMDRYTIGKRADGKVELTKEGAKSLELFRWEILRRFSEHRRLSQPEIERLTGDVKLVKFWP